MTLAIAVKYPYGRLANALESSGARYNQAIIFVTDSRWSYANPEEFEDIGAKVFAIDNSTVMAYSGDVAAAENCITTLSQKIATKKRVPVTNVLQRTYQHHKTERNDVVGPVLFLLGKCTSGGEATLLFLKSPDFSPQKIQGVKSIGNQDAYAEVGEKVAPILDDIAGYSYGEQDHMTMAIHIVSAMSGLEYKDIGGPMQCMILSSGGVVAPELAYTKDPTGETDNWHTVTPGANDVTTFKKRWNLHPDYLTKKSFGLYSHRD